MKSAAAISNQKRRRWARIAVLALLAVIFVFTMLLGLYIFPEFDLRTEAESQGLSYSDLDRRRSTFLFSVGILLLAAMALFFVITQILWQYRILQNFNVLVGGKSRISPFWVVIAWLLPVINFLGPPSIMRVLTRDMGKVLEMKAEEKDWREQIRRAVSAGQAWLVLSGGAVVTLFGLQEVMGKYVLVAFLMVFGWALVALLVYTRRFAMMEDRLVELGAEGALDWA